MPGCPAGAHIRPGEEGLASILDIETLPISVANLISQVVGIEHAAYFQGLVDVPALCQSNPEPPKPIDQALLDTWSTYVWQGPVTGTLTALQYVEQYLRYQLFQAHCICNAPPVDPAHNCLHAVNVVLPGGSTAPVSLGNLVIDQAVLDSWFAANPTNQLFSSTAALNQVGGPVAGLEWSLQVQSSNGLWGAIWDNNQIPVVAGAPRTVSLSGGPQTIRTTTPCRINRFVSTARTITALDFCAVPIVGTPLPIPPQPALPGLPTVPAPICDTTDLCSIVLEIARSVSRLAGQLSDIQATVGGTDQFVTLGSQSISGEGEALLAVGTRAVSIELTHLGQGVFTSALGNPRGLMRAGSIRWGDGTGFSKRQFIDAEDFTRLRPQGSLTVDWQLINECSGTLRFLG